MPKLSYDELEQKVRSFEEVEAKLRESEEKFRLAFHTNPDSINLNRGSDGMYIDINEGFTRLMGYSREEVIGKTSLELNIWVDSKDRERLVAGLTEKGYVDDLEARFRRKNGEIGIGLMSARILKINRENVILSITRDITERKRAEEEIRESERRFRTLFERSNDAIFVIDKQSGRIVDANDAAVSLTGRAPDDLCRLTMKDIISEKEEAHLAEAAHSDKPMCLGRITCYRTDGTKRIVFFNTVPLDAEKVFGIARDMTNEARLEEQFRQAQKMEAIGQLAGGIAHDLNNLLVPIIGYTELALMSLPPENKLYVNLQSIREAGERAATLTRQILAFSRKQVLQIKPLDLNNVVANFEKMLRRLIGEDIALNTILKPSLPSVNADPSQIEQILMNLVVNARDAMPQGGNLTIETDNVFLDEHFTKYQVDVRPGSYNTLAVSDTGVGMSDETKVRIFEPFFTTKPQGKGTGLGLATVFGIVKQHGGNIWVYSELGHGTIFKIYLPQAAATEQPDNGAKEQPVSFYGSETMLVVEDDPMVRRFACETLAMFGYRVIEAKTPTEGIELASGFRNPIHLLLTDVVMPLMNGRRLFEAIAAVHPEIKVLYMSGFTDDVIVHQGILEKNVHFLQKPFTVTSLTEKVREVLASVSQNQTDVS